MTGRTAVLCLLLVSAALAAYSNHFHNDFQFDDLNAVPNNPAIRDLRMIPKFFLDPALFSVAPEQRNYRPVTSASLAVDYWLGGGLDTFAFHLSTFLWYAVQLVLMFLLFRRLMDMADPHPSNIWTALAAAAAFGLHPASAETVNYVIQRADLYNALGSVASLWLFIRYPSHRKFAWYLLPAVAAMLAKPPALVFPLLLFAYVLLFEQDGIAGNRNRWKAAIRSTVPALAVAAAAALLLARMQVGTVTEGPASRFLYRITQPWVALHYFKSFFLPTELSADAGWPYVPGPFSPHALAGYVFVLAMLAAAVAASRRQYTRPVAFGILWFLVTLAPTSLVPLADVMNDHRMFFPFVGLTLAVFWSLRLALFHQTAGFTRRLAWAYGAVAALAMVLVLAGAATRERNQVWSSPESLWRDATLKDPRNQRAWSNYGAILYGQGDYQAALSDWVRAAALDPACAICQFNLIRASAQLHRDDAVARNFQRLLAMYPAIANSYIAYADWLLSVGRVAESGRVLQRAARLFPPSPELRRVHLAYFLQRDAGDRIAAIRAIDTNGDLVLSAGELLAAPQALLALDKNGDGKLSAEECGANFGDETKLSPESLKLARRRFMSAQPVLRALDADHDGEISATEIRNAWSELESLDHNGDHALEPEEMVPEYVVAAARSVLAALDQDHDGRIDAKERSGEAGARFRDLLEDADMDGDGIVTLDELIDEIFYRADLNKDGIVTAEELNQAARRGMLGPLSVATRFFSRLALQLPGKNVP